MVSYKYDTTAVKFESTGRLGTLLLGAKSLSTTIDKNVPDVPGTAARVPLDSIIPVPGTWYYTAERRTERVCYRETETVAQIPDAESIVPIAVRGTLVLLSAFRQFVQVPVPGFHGKREDLQRFHCSEPQRGSVLTRFGSRFGDFSLHIPTYRFGSDVFISKSYTYEYTLRYGPGPQVQNITNSFTPSIILRSTCTRRFAPRAAYAARYAYSGRKNSVKRTKRKSMLDCKCKLAT